MRLALDSLHSHIKEASLLMFVICWENTIEHQFAVTDLSGHCTSVSTPPQSRVSDNDGGFVLHSQSSGHGCQLSIT